LLLPSIPYCCHVSIWLMPGRLGETDVVAGVTVTEKKDEHSDAMLLNLEVPRAVPVTALRQLSALQARRSRARPRTLGAKQERAIRE
jgi:hypothetical protein